MSYHQKMVECKSLMLCQYFEELLRSILSLKNFIVADRNGYWNGHLQAAKDLLPLFRECENINYLRYASLYLEQMRNLHMAHPDIGYMLISN